MLVNIARLITPSGRTKSAFLKDQAEANNSLFVGVTETWLNDGVLDSEVTHNFPGYSLLRCDRSGGRQGGGVTLYLREDLSGDVLATYANSVCELLVVKIQLYVLPTDLQIQPSVNFLGFLTVLMILCRRYQPQLQT